MKLRLYHKVIIAGVCALLAGGVLRSVYSISVAVPVMAEYATLPTIIIDPGHGGVDGGAVGVDNIVEKDINLDIGLTLRDIFLVSGFEVVMTRDSDLSIHDEGIESVRKQKTSDLHNRLAIAEAHPDALFISLHQNKFGDSRSHGAQIFYGPKNEQSEKLARILQGNFVADLQPENNRQCKEAGKNLFLMYSARCPAVLVECGFLSNPEEAARLVDPDYQAKLAFVTYRSVMEFLELDVPAVPQVEAVGEATTAAPR